jgi:hypothetical protein
LFNIILNVSAEATTEVTIGEKKIILQTGFNLRLAEFKAKAKRRANGIVIKTLPAL